MPTINSRFLYFLLCVALITGCNRCKEECDDPTNPECPNYCPPVDPCEGINEVSADFTISQRASNSGEDFDIIIETQNIIIESAITIISAIEEGASYKWILGADTIYDQTYEFIFQEEFIGQTIPIKLIVFKEPDTICFPLDNGMDTIVKYVLVKDGCDASFQGLYFGAFTSAPSDSFFVSFKRKDNENWLPDDCMELWLRGVNGDFNDSCRVNEYGATDNYIKVADDYCATNEGIDDPIGSFYFDISNGTVSGSYDLQFWDGSQETIVNRIFNGRKIN